MAFVHADGSIPDSSRFNDDAITASLICTNRMLPARLHTGDICVAVNKNPAVASFRNVTRPDVAPLAGDGWRHALVADFRYEPELSLPAGPGDANPDPAHF
ncbi:type VI secretion protein, family [Salmonella enterica subsp. salamae]|uniref:Type VI secretion protein, family n=1 Tax=Salmonella enterica subsp. salamae TaxID=59202 RepID=A0A6D2GBS1_SALER|nr:type VI secretion protein, family [Salmonella enterica subsp. salamae]